MDIHFKNINMHIKKAHMEDTVLALLKQENINKEEYDNDFGIKNKIADIGLDIFFKKCNGNYDELSDNEYIDLCIWILSQFCTRDRVKDIILSWQYKIDNNQIDNEFGNMIIYLASLHYTLDQFYFNNDIELLQNGVIEQRFNGQDIIDKIIRNKEIIPKISLENMKFFIRIFKTRLEQIEYNDIIFYRHMPMRVFEIINIYYNANHLLQNKIQELYIVLYDILVKLDMQQFKRIYLEMLPLMTNEELVPLYIKQYADKKYIEEKE